MRTTPLVLASAASLALAASALAEDYLPAVVFDMGGIDDGSFNESVYNGVERFKADTGIDYASFEVTDPSQREELLRSAAELGANPILGIGFAQADAIAAVATDYPGVQFGIIDVGWLDLPNLQQFVYAEHEGSFLVGMIAGLTTQTDTVGFVGGMSIDLIRKFQCGYEQGVAYANADASVIANMTGDDPSAWSNPERGYELTVGQISQGADVVYHAAGGTGFGVLQAAADNNIFGIGVDANQNPLHPGSVLTSMLKRVDVTAYDFFAAGQEAHQDTMGDLVSGVTLYNLANNGVGYAVDANNQALISADVQAAVAAAEAAIIAGDLSVHDYFTTGSCENAFAG